MPYFLEDFVNTVAWYINTRRKRPGSGADLASFRLEEAARVRNFHKSFKEYTVTPLVPLPALAAHMNIDGLYVKDESKRFGLNAFKVLGGSYAIGRLLAERLHRPLEALGREMLCSDAVRAQLGEITFATDRWQPRARCRMDSAAARAKGRGLYAQRL